MILQEVTLLTKTERRLHTIHTQVIKKKIAIFACDACLMAGDNVLRPLKNNAEFFVRNKRLEEKFFTIAYRRNQ